MSEQMIGGTMIDFNRSGIISDLINNRIDAALEIERSFQPKRKYLGGSRVGLSCERALQYEITNTPPDQTTDGRMVRIFARGKWVENAMVGWMRTAGFGIVPTDEYGNQFGFEAHNGLVKGHCDGVIVAGPDELGPWPRLWENKGLMQKYYLPIVKHGLKAKSEVYWGQAQYYMEKFGLTKNPALFSVVNMNTMEIYWEEIRHDPGFVLQLDAKAKRVLLATQAGEMLPRISKTDEFYVCKMCSYVRRCFESVK
jgi:hypothetical protein